MPPRRRRWRVPGRAAAGRGRESSFDHPVSEAPAVVEADAGSDAAQKDRSEKPDEVAEPPAQPTPDQGPDETKEAPHRRALISGNFSRVFDTDVGKWRLVWPHPDLSARPARGP